jgi:hypothetical protein
MDNIKMSFGELECGGMDWIDLAQDGTSEGSCEHGNEHSGYVNVAKFLSSCTTGGISKSVQVHEVRLVVPRTSC